MAAITGTNLYLKFGGTVLDTDYRTFGGTRTIDSVDASAGSDTYKTYLTTLKDGTRSATIVVQAADTSTKGTLVPGVGGTLEWGLEGTASGSVKALCTAAFVSSYNESMSYNDLVVVDVSWQLNADVTDSTY